MRKIGKREIDRHKCIMCGSKNKLISDIVFNEEVHGHIIRCCACGHLEQFIDKSMIPQDLYSKNVKIVPSNCIQSVPCPYTDCPYYAWADEWKEGEPVETGNKPIENPLQTELSVKQTIGTRFL